MSTGTFASMVVIRGHSRAIERKKPLVLQRCMVKEMMVLSEKWDFKSDDLLISFVQNT